MRSGGLYAMLAATLAAGAVGGCGKNDELVPASQASAIDESLQRVADATNSGDCDGAANALKQAQAGFDRLPSSVDAGLRERILAGLEQLNQTVPEQCSEDSFGTEDPALTTETAPDDLTSVEPPPTTDPLEPTEPPEETVPPVDTQPVPDPGGVSPDTPPGPDGQGPPGQADGVPPGQEDEG